MTDAGRRVSPKVSVTLPSDELNFIDNRIQRYAPKLTQEKRSARVSFCIRKVIDATEGKECSKGK